MTFLTIKIFLKKVWIFLKRYWYLPVLVIVFIIAAIVLRRKPESLAQTMKKTFDLHKKEVDVLEKIHAEEIEKREKALNDYHNKIKDIENKFEEENIKLDEKKKREIAKRVKDSNENIDLLAKDIAKTWGFEFKSEK